MSALRPPAEMENKKMYTETKRALGRSGLFVSLLALAVMGCGGDGGSAGPAVGSGGGSNGGGSGSAGESGASGAGGESGSANCSQTDEPDADGTDDNCDGADGIVGTDVYVAPTGSDTNPGTPDAPIRTIKKGLELAHSRSARVLVAAGDFEVSALSQPGDVKIHGGYPAAFLGARQATATSLKTSSPLGIAVTDASSVYLETLSIVGASADDPSQRSSQALVLDVPESKLVDVRVVAQDALSGGGGEDGLSGAAGKDGKTSQGAYGLSCDGKAQPSFAFGADAGKKNSAGGQAGSCFGKTAAAVGVAGIVGTDGANAPTSAAFDGGVLHWANASDGIDDAKPGFGGAGGGTCEIQNLAGGGGGGGCPGTPGTGGESGGGAIGIVVLSGKLTLEGSSIRTGFAGDGGNGGKGGAGGPGGGGGVPECPVGWDCTKIVKTCTPATDPWKTNCARWGGSGGPGGSGGHGGGGVGGWTVGIVTLGAATSEFDSATSFELGSPGKGGEGAGGVRAPNGEKRKQLAID